MKNKFSREHWLSPDVLGFAAHWAWIWCVFWSSRFYEEGAQLGAAAFTPGTMQCSRSESVV